MLLKPPVAANRSPFLVSSDWVEQHLGALRLLDGSYSGEASQVYVNIHLPGAQRFDIDVIKDAYNPLPHMLPDADTMSHHLSQLGLHPDDTVVIYDQQGLFGAPRVWWMLRAYGFENVYILEHGLPGWYDAQRPVEAGNELRPSADIQVSLRSDLLASKQDVKNAAGNTTQIVDARSAARFDGAAPEPRPGMRSGHMPGALNLPYTDLLDGDTLKTLDELKTIIDNAGIDLSAPLISTCGSGVTAAFLCLALQSLGISNWQLYDGSWSEWGAATDCDVVKAA